MTESCLPLHHFYGAPGLCAETRLLFSMRRIPFLPSMSNIHRPLLFMTIHKSPNTVNRHLSVSTKKRLSPMLTSVTNKERRVCAVACAHIAQQRTNRASSTSLSSVPPITPPSSDPPFQSLPDRVCRGVAVAAHHTPSVLLRKQQQMWCLSLRMRVTSFTPCLMGQKPMKQVSTGRKFWYSTDGRPRHKLDTSFLAEETVCRDFVVFSFSCICLLFLLVDLRE